MEEAFLTDDSQFESLELAEDELIDAYIRDELSAEERQQFKARILTSPRLAERVHFAKAIREKIDASFSLAAENSLAPVASISIDSRRSKWWESIFPQQPVWRTAMVACLGLFLVAGLVSVFGWLRLRNESERLASERAALEQQKLEFDKRLREEQTRAEQANANVQRDKDSRAEDLRSIDKPDEPNKLGTRRNGSTTLALTLNPGAIRSEGNRAQLTARPGLTTAPLGLVLGRNDYRSYKIEIKGLNADKVVFRQSGLKPKLRGSDQTIILSVPMKRLPPDDYTVNLYGLTASGTAESVDDYYFRVPGK